MAPRHSDTRVDKPDLNDELNWIPLTIAHQVLSEHLIGVKGASLATMKLTEWLQNGDLPFMRRTVPNPSKSIVVTRRRQRGRAAFWHGREIYIDDNGFVNFTTPTRRPFNNKTKIPWRYFVWKPSLDKLMQSVDTGQNLPKGRKRGPKLNKNWRLHCAAELFRYYEAGKPMPSAAKLAEYLQNEIGYQPEASEINSLVRYLIG